MKRTFDLTVGLVLALLVTPVILVLAVISAVRFRAWPFFTQPRVGRANRTFRVIKIRSLPTSTPAAIDKHELHSRPIEGYSQFIRGHHLDELPQLWQVPFGRMSLVGPRPEMPHLLDRFTSNHREVRAQWRPGCTGLWQISPASAGMMYEAPEYDAFYGAQQCLRLDLWVLWRTAAEAAGAKGITLADVPRSVCAAPAAIAEQPAIMFGPDTSLAKVPDL